MFNNVLEISEKVNGNGRVPAKIIFHKIHEDSEETNSNGLHWKEEYVRNNMASLADDVELDLEDLNMLTFMDVNKEKNEEE